MVGWNIVKVDCKICFLGASSCLPACLTLAYSLKTKLLEYESFSLFSKKNDFVVGCQLVPLKGMHNIQFFRHIDCFMMQCTQHARYCDHSLVVFNSFCDSRSRLALYVSCQLTVQLLKLLDAAGSSIKQNIKGWPNLKKSMHKLVKLLLLQNLSLDTA